MRLLHIAGVMAVAGLLSACGSADAKKAAAPVGNDGGAGGELGALAGQGGNAEAGVNPVLGAAGGGGAAAEAMAGQGGVPSTDQGGEGGVAQAGAGGSQESLHVLYATFDGVLVRIDPDTAALEEVAEVRDAAQPTTVYAELVLAWDHQLGQARVIVTPFTSPRLGVLDLCTGAVTAGPTLTLASAQVPNAEAFAQHPNGSWYVASGSTQYFSVNVGTLDVGSGAVTHLGTLDTVQDDSDHFDFVGSQLYSLDVGATSYGLYLIDLATGAATPVATPAATSATAPQRISFDVTRDRAFGWHQADHNLLEIDLADASLTPLGQTHPPGAYGDAPARGFMSAPPAACP